MRSFRHWTPRYALDRIRLEFFSRVHADAPWLAAAAVATLDRKLRPTDIVLEFGSGRSTLWFAKRVHRLISVEHDTTWFERVGRDLRRAAVTNVDQRLASRAAYLGVLEELEAESLDLVLDDGLERDAVALGSLPLIKPGGTLVIDDAGRYVPATEFGGALARPSPHRRADYASDSWRDVAEATADWQRVWLTNGVTDTLLLTKPDGDDKHPSALRRTS